MNSILSMNPVQKTADIKLRKMRNTSLAEMVEFSINSFKSHHVCEQSPQRFYGKFARIVQRTAQLFSRKYRCDFAPSKEPCVYVCRHLNMHGPFVTLKWLPQDVHPFVLKVFLDEKTAARQFTDYTFSRRFGKEPPKFSFCGALLGWCAAKVVRSLQAVPVCRDTGAIHTMRCAMNFLKTGESLIVWPDIRYTEGYEHPCEIYRGFLYLGEMYERTTGQKLSFIPLYVDDARKIISAGAPVNVSRYCEDGEHAARQLEKAMDQR